MKIRNNNKKGTILLLALGIISFLSILSIATYRLANEQRITSDGTAMKEEASQAAENAINVSLQDFNYLVKEVGSDISSLISSEKVICIKNNEKIELESGVSDCSTSNGYKNGELVSQATTKRKDELCLSWGSSDKIVECLEITGKGQFLNSKIKIENIQELNFYKLKNQESDIYEF